MPEMPFPNLMAMRRTGAEPFRDGSAPLNMNLLAFWQWSASDLVSNTTRGRLAEFIVAHALGVAGGVRSEWDSYDLRLPGGLTVEVKSAAYLQSWAQKKLSAASFRIGATRSWDPVTGEMASEVRRQADIYVFALLAHRNKPTLDPLDVSQWEFYVLRTAVLNSRLPNQKQLTLGGLLQLGPVKSSYSGLRAAVAQVAAG